MTLQERLGIENRILISAGMPQFQVYRRDAYYYLWGEQRTNSGHFYSIWCPIPNGYPYERPETYIYKPNPLYGYANLRTINSYGLSHNMHTLESGPNGEVQICHWRSDRWHSGITLDKVMIKVMLWLEAYEQHLSSGQTISQFVATMREV